MEPDNLKQLMCSSSTQIEKEPLANLPLSNIRPARKSASGPPSNPLLSIKFNGPVLPPPFGFPETTDVPVKLEKGACNLQGGLEEVTPISPAGTKDEASSTMSTDAAPCPPGRLKVDALSLSTSLGEMEPMRGLTDGASSPSMSLEESTPNLSCGPDEESSVSQTSLEGVAPGELDGKALPPCKSVATISAATLGESAKIPSTGMNEVTKIQPNVVIEVERAPFNVVHIESSTKPETPNKLRLIPLVNEGLHESAPTSPDSDRPAPLQPNNETSTETVEYVDAEVQTVAAWCYIIGVAKISHGVDVCTACNARQEEDPVEVLTRSSNRNRLMSFICPTCRARRIASVEGKPGFEAMMSRRLLPVVGYICERCIIPCFFKRCSNNADYVCPNCQQYI